MKTRERRALAGLFFLFGFGIMSWVPRFPEVKHNLGVSNGEFGTLISIGAIGSILSLVSVGHLVHRYGARKLLTASALVLYTALILVVHVRETWQFLICNFFVGLGLAAFHTALNGQALHEQKPEVENIMPRLHGLWSLGALATAIISGLLTSRVSLNTHISILSVSIFLIDLYLLKVIAPTLLQGNSRHDDEVSFRDIFAKGSIDWLMAISLTCAVMLEFAIADWAAIFSKEELHMSPGVATIPYICFITAMIVGRLTVHKIVKRIGLADLIRRCVISGGVIFLVCNIVGVQVNKTSAGLGFAIIAFGALCAGLGASFLAPTIMNAANLRSKAPGAVVIGQLGALNTIAVFFLKWVIAWTAQFTSISVALVIPTLMLISLYFLANTFEQAGTKVS